MITAIHRRGNLISKRLASRINPGKSKIYRTFRRTKDFVRVFELCHCMPDININDNLRVPVVNEDILDSLKFILNFAVTTNVKNSTGKTSN